MPADAPAALIAIGACAREDPHPKFFPATMKSPEETFDANEASMSSMQCRASSAGSEVFRYRAGMMTSVSTSSPYFHALPRSSMLELIRPSDPAEHRGGRGHGGVGEVHLALGVPHPADEVPVRRRDRPLPLRQDPHVAAKARPAGGGGEGRPRRDERLHQSLPHRLQVDLLGGGKDEHPHAVVDLPHPA